MKKVFILILALCLSLPSFASCGGEKLTLRVGTYNIKNGGNVDYDMSVIAADIVACDLDIVGLQEVDMKTKRCGGIDTLKLLAEAAGYEYYEFAKAIDYQGGEYGTAIMSRYPITSFEVTKLPTNKDMEGRALGHAVIDVDGKNIDFFNTHLSYEDKAVIKKQFKQLNNKVNKSNTFIITADFNTNDDSNYELIQKSIRANNNEFNTYSNKSAIDDIILCKKWNIIDKGMQDVSGHSDHNLFWAEIQYK